MQSEFSPSLTRLDAVLWFLRVQFWLTLFGFMLGFATPYLGVFGSLTNVQNWVGAGLPVLILAIFPRMLASSVVGGAVYEPLVIADLRWLAGRCVGLALFVNSLGRTVLLTLTVAMMFLSPGRSGFSGSYYPAFFWSQAIGTGLSFIIGFFLAFGPRMGGSFSAR